MNQHITERGERMDAFIVVHEMIYNPFTRKTTQWFVYSIIYKQKALGHSRILGS